MAESTRERRFWSRYLKYLPGDGWTLDYTFGTDRALYRQGRRCLELTADHVAIIEKVKQSRSHDKSRGA